MPDLFSLTSWKDAKITEVNESRKKETFKELMKLIANKFNRPLDYPPILLILLFCVHQEKPLFFCDLSGVWHEETVNNSLIALATAKKEELDALWYIVKAHKNHLHKLDWKKFLWEFKKLPTAQQTLKPFDLLYLFSCVKDSEPNIKKNKNLLAIDFFHWMVETTAGQAYLAKMSADDRCRAFVEFLINGEHRQVDLIAYYDQHNKKIRALLLQQKPALQDFDLSVLDIRHPLHWSHFYTKKEFFRQYHRTPRWPFAPAFALLLLKQFSLLKQGSLSHIKINCIQNQSMTLDSESFPDIRQFSAAISAQELSQEKMCVTHWLELFPRIQQLHLSQEDNIENVPAAGMRLLLSKAAQRPTIRLITLSDRIHINENVLEKIVKLIRLNPLLLIQCNHKCFRHFGRPQISAYENLLLRNQEIIKRMKTGHLHAAKKIFWGQKYQAFQEETVLPETKVVPLKNLCASILFFSPIIKTKLFPSPVFNETQQRETFQSMIRIPRQNIR